MIFKKILLFVNSPPAVQYVSAHSKGQIAVVEDEEQLQKFLSIKSNLPDLRGNFHSKENRIKYKL